MAEGSGFAGYGYTDSGGEKIAALIDMINGGGAGRAGQEFEGGGILSLIANALFSPYGSQARGADSPATAMRPPGRPAGGAPAPSGLPSLRGPAGGPPPAPRPSPAAATAPALRGPAGGPPPSAPATRPAPAMPTGGPGTFAPGRLPAARTPAMTGAPSTAEMLELESYLANATRPQTPALRGPAGGPPPAARPTPALPSDPASRDPIGMATIPRIPMGGFLPSEVRNLPAGPDNRGPMASVEGPMLPEMLDAAPPPADSVLMASEMLPPFMGGRPEMADTPRVPPTRIPAVGDTAGKTPAEVARGVTAPAGALPTRALPSDPSVMASLRDYPVRNETQAESLMRNTPRVPSDSRPATPMGLRDRFVTRFDPGRPPGARPRARPQEFTFEYFVESLGPAAEGVSPEILRTAYRNFLQGYEAN